MLENKIQQEQLTRERFEQKEIQLQRARELVTFKREEKEQQRANILMAQQKKWDAADQVRAER